MGSVASLEEVSARDATVVIPAYNPPQEIFPRVIDAAIGSGLPIVVVDASVDDRVECVARDHKAEVFYHRLEDHRGVAHSRNVCASIASSRRLIYLDSDAIPVGDWASPMLERLDEPDIAVVGARIVPLWEQRPSRLFRSFVAGIQFSLLDLGDCACDLPRVIGTSYAIDRHRVPSPPFDERTGRKPGTLVSGEENRLCVQSRLAGYRVVYEPRSVVQHHVPRERLNWSWMLARAYASGKEQAITGREERLVERRWGLDDYLFKLGILPAFYSGRMSNRLIALRRR